MSNIVLAAGSDDAALQISRSVRLRSSATAYLSKTFASAGNRKKWTYSVWIKRGTLGSYGALIASKVDGNNYSSLEFSGDELRFVQAVGGSITVNKRPVALFRDPSAWYHIIAVMDTDNATAEDRFILYVNGVRVTTWASNTPPSLGLATGYINSTTAQWIGLDANPLYFDGYLADVNFIDGLALAASSFGETDLITGVWKPKGYSGSRGTNGFYLPFTDNSSTTNLVKDASGNGNNWTPNNISLTAGVTYDSMTDVPMLTSATAANFAVLNAVDASLAPTNGNLGFAQPSAAYATVRGTIGMTTGKWAWEVFINTGAVVICLGIANSSTPRPAGAAAAGAWMYDYDGVKYNNGAGPTAYGTSYTTGDTLRFEFDADAGSLVIFKNNTSQGVLVSGLPAGTYFPWVALYNGGSSPVVSFNFGQRPFTNTPTSGFLALNTFNLPSSIVPDGRVAMAATTYTGNGSTQAVSNAVNGVSFAPDFVWVKYRNQAYNHDLFDSIRGVSKYLRSNSTTAELTYSGYGVTAFNSNGFSVTDDSGGSYEVNGSSGSLVAWQWKAGGTPVSNTAGSITSSVSANTTAGFSVVTWTGNGSTSGVTIGHGLGVAPSMVILKARSSATDWVVYHASVGNTKGLFLNLTNAATTNAAYWNNTTPTSTVFTTTGDTGASNQSGVTYVTYCFAPVAGYSAFGSYTGNGSADGSFVHLGFRARFLLIKNSSSAGNHWIIIDTARDTYNLSIYKLGANTSAVENDAATVGTASNNMVDILSNGFKMRSSNGDTNGSGTTYIYMAFAENPFKNSLAR